MGVGHYENFPVASVLLPARLRGPIATIYHFARTADDIADEGDAPPEVRLRALADLDAKLTALATGKGVDDPLFVALGRTIHAHRLPFGYFHDLLSAFSQDCVKTRYRDFDDLQDYARRSANPVGRLLLHLFGDTAEEALHSSDRICSALQYINFWQDVAIDIRKGRIYLPMDDVARFGVSESDIAQGFASSDFRALLAFEVQRTRDMLHAGAPLGRRLPGRIGLEIRTIVAGGDAILQKIIDVDYDVFRYRPVLKPFDWLGMMRRAIFSDGRIRTAAA